MCHCGISHCCVVKTGELAVGTRYASFSTRYIGEPDSLMKICMPVCFHKQYQSFVCVSGWKKSLNLC